jgi:hypothetical protein
VFDVGPENVVWHSARETDGPDEYECSDDPLLELVAVVVVVIPLFVALIDGKSSENTTESVSNLSFNTTGVAAPVCWFVRDNIMPDNPLLPIPKEFPFGFASFSVSIASQTSRRSCAPMSYNVRFKSSRSPIFIDVVSGVTDYDCDVVVESQVPKTIISH